jgi:hypothetical protein
MIVAKNIRAHILKGPKRIKGIWDSEELKNSRLKNQKEALKL